MKKFFLFLLVATVGLFGCEEDEVSLANAAPESRGCGSTNALVGQSRELRVSGIYGISGTVTILSDCEIEFSNFFYNGAGPNVSIYGGNNGNFEAGLNLSQPINGRRFTGETFTVFLPEGTSLDNINSFSVWCFEFDIDFSSASFQ